MGVINVCHYGLTPVYTYMAGIVGCALCKGHLFIALLGAGCSLGHIKVYWIIFLGVLSQTYPMLQNPSEKEEQLMCLLGKVSQVVKKSKYSRVISSKYSWPISCNIHHCILFQHSSLQSQNRWLNTYVFLV